MNDINIRIILAVFAIYRIANIISREAGPFSIFAKFRGMLYTRYEAGRLLEIKGYKIWLTLHELFICPFCLGVWLSLLFTVIVYWNNQIADMILLLFGIAGGQFLMATIGDYFVGNDTD